MRYNKMALVSLAHRLSILYYSKITKFFCKIILSPCAVHRSRNHGFSNCLCTAKSLPSPL